MRNWIKNGLIISLIGFILIFLFTLLISIEAATDALILKAVASLIVGFFIIGLKYFTEFIRKINGGHLFLKFPFGYLWEDLKNVI